MKFIKKIFCRHKHKKQIQRGKYLNPPRIKYGKECKRCGRKWWL